MNTVAPRAVGVPQHFLVFPDTDRAADIVNSFSLVDFPQTLRYMSGRVAVRGSWELNEIQQVNFEGAQCIAIGSAVPDVSWFERSFKRYIDEGDIGVLNGPGSYYLIIFTRGKTIIRGTLSDFKRLFFCQVGEIDIVSTRADFLAEVTNASVDRYRIVNCLLEPFAPHPLNGKSLWSKVHNVAPGDYLTLEGVTGKSDTKTYWRAPDKSVSLGEGAEKLKSALQDSISVRTAQKAGLSSDVSGGLDSTSLFCLAASKYQGINGFTSGTFSTFDSELSWAEKGIGESKFGEHLLLLPGDFPLPFDDIGKSYLKFDEPYMGEVVKSRIRVVADFLALNGTVHHLMGHGGDELFSNSPTYLSEVFRRGNWSLMLRVLNQYHALRKTPKRDIMNWVINSGKGYSYQLRGYADRLFDNSKSGKRATWTPLASSFPSWATPEARRMAADCIYEISRDAQPLSDRFFQHEILEKVQNAARILRHDSEIMRLSGVRMEVPYFDDDVIEAVLSVDPSETGDLKKYRPLLKESMKDVIPDSIMKRTTKTEATPEIWLGLKGSQGQLEFLCKDMILEDMGLIDARKFQSSLLGPQSPQVSMASLWKTLACELWLRDLHGIRRAFEEKS